MGGSSESGGGPSEGSGGPVTSGAGGAAGTGGASVSGSAGSALEGIGGSSFASGGVSAIAGSASAPVVPAGGGTGGDTMSAEAGAGGASPDASCHVVWGTPSDPGYRGIRGTVNGQPLSVDADDMAAEVGFCFPDGPGETPAGCGFGFSVLGMTVGAGDCQARITSPSDTIWHDLDIQLSVVAALPTADTSAVKQPAWHSSVMSGHVHLQGQGSYGPITIDADFYLELRVRDSCAPPPPKID
jgi:hypothetical protein